MPRKKKEELADEATMFNTDPEFDQEYDEAAEISFEVSGEIVSQALLPEEDADEPDILPDDDKNEDDILPSEIETRLVSTKTEESEPRRKSITELNLRKLDRNLSPLQRQEWESIYASHRAKSLLTGTVMGVDSAPYTMVNRETGETERKTLYSLAIVGYRVKVLIPETELWHPGEERPAFVLPGMVGSRMDYVIMNIDRQGEFAIGSRRMAMSKKRKRFVRSRHEPGQSLQCRVIAVGPSSARWSARATIFPSPSEN